MNSKMLSFMAIAAIALILQPINAFAWGCSRSFSGGGGRGGSFSHSGSTSGGWGGFSHSGSSSYTGRFGNTYSTSHSASGGYGGYHYGGYGGYHYGGCYGGGFAAGAVTGAVAAAAASNAAYYNQPPYGAYYRPVY